MAFYSFIHSGNPVKSISLACPGLNGALIELNWFSQCPAPTDMCGPVPSQFNPFTGGFALRLRKEGYCWFVHSQTETGNRAIKLQEAQQNVSLLAVEFRLLQAVTHGRTVEPDAAGAFTLRGVQYLPLPYRERPFWHVAMFSLRTIMSYNVGYTSRSDMLLQFDPHALMVDSVRGNF